MKVQVAAKCGFCPGVRRAISTAEAILSTQGDHDCVFSLGPVIHNRDEVRRLEKEGLKVIQSIDEVDGGTSPTRPTSSSVPWTQRKSSSYNSSATI